MVGPVVITTGTDEVRMESSDCISIQRASGRIGSDTCSTSVG